MLCFVKFVYVNKSSLTVTSSCNRKEQESQYCMHGNIWMMGLQLILQFLLMKTRYLQFILNGFFFFYFFVASCFIFAKDRIGAERKTLCIDSIFSYLLDYSKNYLINSFKGDCT